ncbi:MAG: dihydrolipoyllysine-residue acetyltransferase [Myxococcales bacterium]|nr:dihydrolipoyllysine-residue acetyltransferase [Myxococcales bacterium]
MDKLIEVKVPDIGDFADVEIVEVLISEGDHVDVEAPLIMLESDKASIEVPSSATGVVKQVNVKVGGRVSQGDIVILLEPSAAINGDTNPSTPTPAKTPSAPEPSKSATKETESDEEGGPAPAETRASQAAHHVVPPTGAPGIDINEEDFAKAHASPSVRRFARELGANLVRIRGNGRKGRVTRQDVVAYVKAALAQTSAPGASAGSNLGIPAMPEIDFSKFGEIETTPLSRIQKISGPVLHRAWLNVPHVTHHDEADITELDKFRKDVDKKAKEEGYRITLLSFLIKAVVTNLQDLPSFNSSLSSDGQSLILKKYYNVGVAVDTPNGLVVPVVKDVNKKGIVDISKDLAVLSKKARDGKLGPKELQGGTFSISSLGGIGGTSFTPIVFAPEVAILGVSRSRMTPVWNGESFVPRLMLPLSLSYDHRVIDGAAAARFVARLGQLLDDARRMLL